MKQLLLVVLLSAGMVGQEKVRDDARVFACHCDDRHFSQKDGRMYTEHIFASQDKCRYSIGRSDMGTERISEPATTEWQVLEGMPKNWHEEYRWYCGGEDVPKGQHCKPSKYIHVMCTTHQPVD